MRRAPQIAARRVPRALDRIVRMRPAPAWLIVLLLGDAAALGDFATGTRLWFGPVYLFVMCLATWARGWHAGQAVGIACMGLTFALNGPSLYPYGGSEFAWNLAMRFIAVWVVIAVIAGMRGAYLREWWLARTDILTGALNRQAFFELGNALAGCDSWRLLAYADLDGLKAINDGRGHAAGDACLAAYAGRVRGIIRRDDLFARVGGDEFLIFMVVKDEDSARAVAARLHGAMNRIPVASGGHLRCSVGALVVPPGRASIDGLVRSADSLMYRAKTRGACLEFATACEIETSGPASGARQAPRPAALALQAPRGGLAERRAVAEAPRG